MRKIIIVLFFLVVGATVQAQPVLRTMLRLPDTGQQNSYTSTFGEDSDYLINQPAYTLNGDGTVTDTNTTLMWQQTDGGEMTIEAAMIYCDTLTLGGYQDWRMPNCHELFSILNHDRPNPAMDTNYFTNTRAEYWWSNQRQMNDSNKVWVTNAGGGVGNHLKTETISAGGTKKFHVRAVRDVVPPITLPNHFINNGDGTTTDAVTNLVWQQIPTADTITWEQALLTADTLLTAGYSDWRMPTIKELQSINEERNLNPSVSSNYFSGIIVGQYWSSTSLPNQTTKAWYWDTRFGITTYAFKTSRKYLLCVRGGDLLTNVNSSPSRDRLTTIFPNPSTGAVTIKCETLMDEVEIISFQGKSQHLFPNASVVQIDPGAPGLYVVKVVSGNLVTSKMLVILGQ